MIVEHLRAMMIWKANAKSHHHECNLRDCRESKTTLDITLSTSYCCCIECCECTYHNDDTHRIWSIFYPNREHTCNLEYTCNNHGSSVDKRRNWCWAFHRIWQPDVKWEHSRLTSTTDEHKNKSSRKNHSTHCSCTTYLTSGESLHSFAKYDLCSCEREIEATSIVTEDKYSDKEEHISETSYNKRFLGSMYCSMKWIVETNEKVRTYTYKLPEHIHLENIGSENETKH